MKIPIISIIGKPNVGKSTLFNRISGKRIAITTEIAGTTRDRIFNKIEHPELDFFMVDTGGIEVGGKDGSIESNIQAQTRIAMTESDLILFLVDARTDMTKDDLHAVELLRKHSGQKSVLLVAGKCDGPVDKSKLASLYKLGMGEPFPISGLHGFGVDKLVAEIIARMKGRHFITKDNPEYKKEQDFAASHLNIALVGRPNVGKSSIVNALLNQEKLIVSDIPGTTRDSVDSTVQHNLKQYNLVDTAGLRRHKNVDVGIEQLSVMRTLSAIERCEVVVLVLDSHEKVLDQDQQIANLILRSNKGVILVANKWDIILNTKMTEEERRSTYVGYLQKKFGFMPWAPVIFTSAKTKKNLTQIFDLAEDIKLEQQKRVSTASLNHCVELACAKHQPTGSKTTPPKIFYSTQVDVNPPRFAFFVNKRKFFHFSFIRYLERKLRDKFGFVGTPILMEFKEKESRYADKEHKRPSRTQKPKKKK